MSAPCLQVCDGRGRDGLTVHSKNLCCSESNDRDRDDSDKRRRTLTLSHVLAMNARLSNLQRHQDVQRTMSRRKGEIPIGRNSRKGNRAVNGLQLKTDKYGPLVRR
jgi:hypothetical protein